MTDAKESKKKNLLILLILFDVCNLMRKQFFNHKTTRSQRTEQQRKILRLFFSQKPCNFTSKHFKKNA